MATYKRGHWSAADEQLYNEQMTIYNGQVVTLAQAIAMKAADARKKKQEEERKRSDAFKKTSVFPEILKHIEKTMKSTRTLKSFNAFLRNGKWQFAQDFTAMMEQFPKLLHTLTMYKIQFKKVQETYDHLEKLVSRNKCHKSFIPAAEDFGYEMLNLLDCLEKIVDVVTKEGIIHNPRYRQRDIINGPPDGKRVGLAQIISKTTESKSKTKSNLLTLQKLLTDAYKFVIANI